MDATEGTKIRGKWIHEGETVACRDWLEFAIIEVRHDGMRVRYRQFDLRPPVVVESGTDGTSQNLIADINRSAS